MRLLIVMGHQIVGFRETKLILAFGVKMGFGGSPSPHPILGYSLPCALIAQLAQHLMLHNFFSLFKTKYGLICSSIDDIAMSYLFRYGNI